MATNNYIEESDTASRRRMTLNDWVDETRQGGIEDLVDPTEIGQMVIDLYQRYHCDPGYIGYRIVSHIDPDVRKKAVARMEEFTDEH